MNGLTVYGGCTALVNDTIVSALCQPVGEEAFFCRSAECGTTRP